MALVTLLCDHQDIICDLIKDPADIIMINCKSNFHRAPAVSMLAHGVLQDSQ